MQALVVVTDLLARSRIAAAAEAAGYEVVARRSVPEPSDAGVAPEIIVVDLDLPGAVAAAGEWRAQRPGVKVVGFAFHTETELIAEAKAAGIDVRPHGATARPATLFS